VHAAVTGAQDGSLYLWEDVRLTAVKRGAHQGPIFVLAVTTLPAGVGAGKGGQLLLSGGVDGVIRQWEVNTAGNFNQV
jgi:WD40 repeat protein